MRSLAISQEHELLKKLESAGLTSEVAQAVITSKGNNLAKKLVEFLKNELKIVEKVLQFLSFICTVKVSPVQKFRVGDFFKHREGNIPMYFDEYFTTWILEESKGLELSLEKEISLSKFKLIKRAWDSEIYSDFKKIPIIPVKIFLTLLKSLIENQPNGEVKEDGLDNSGYSNIFSVDMVKINPKFGVVSVVLFWSGGEWRFFVKLLDYRDGFSVGNHFFSLTTL